MLHFELVRVMGRDTLPAIEIVKKFSKERTMKDRELDLILFMDGSRKRGDARLASEAEFCLSVNRDKAFNE